VAEPLLAKQLSREYNFTSQDDRDQAMRMGSELYLGGVYQGRTELTSELEVCWARIAELRQVLHDYAAEHDRGLSSGTGKRIQCDCSQCEKVREADQWRTVVSG